VCSTNTNTNMYIVIRVLFILVSVITWRKTQLHPRYKFYINQICSYLTMVYSKYEGRF